LYLVSAVGSALAWDWYSFLIFRFIGGLGVGGASVLSPIYIAEIAPAKNRGRLVMLAQFNIVLGILLAYISNYIVTLFNLGGVEWRWMFGVEAFPAAVFIILLFTNPYSPRWLMAKGRKQEALAVLCTLEGDPDVAQTEQVAIQESLDMEHHRRTERFYSKKYLKPILLACAIGAFNQLSGINALIYYGPTIFKMTGAAGENALLQSVIIGLVNLVFTMTALAVIDHFGRKKLMLVGSIGYILSLGVAAWAFFNYSAEFTAVKDAMTAIAAAVKAGATPDIIAALKAIEAEAVAAVGGGGLVVLASLIVFIASHAFGQGAVCWVFMSEVFPNRVRARGQALGSFTLWIFNALVSLTFPMIVGKFGGGAIFSIYCGFMVIQLIWVLVIMPETKGIALEDIQKRLDIE